jgi:outer membrane protease
MGTGFGVICGQASELVYPVDTKGELLSELIWDMKPVVYLGLHADFGLADIMSGPGFFTSLSFKAGIPGKTGRMEDRDWNSIHNGALTNFSSHTNNTHKFFWLDINMGFSFPIKYFYIKPFLSGSWMQFAFTGSGGFYKYAKKISYGTYAPIENATVEHISGKVITYRQNWLLAAAGLSIGVNIFYPFLFELSFQISPITYCSAEDNHISRNTIFRDFTYYGLFFEPGGKVSYDYKNFNFSLEFFYRFIGSTKGDSFSNVKNSGYKITQNKAGAGLSVMDIQFTFKLAL